MYLALCQCFIDQARAQSGSPGRRPQPLEVNEHNYNRRACDHRHDRDDDSHVSSATPQQE